jgi:perosamine synthetase
VRYAGARPVFVDVDAHAQLDPQKVDDFLARECRAEGGRLVNRTSGRRVRALLPVHALGHTADMDPLLDLARRHGLRVVEDAAEALGATYRGRAAGRLGDVGCLSFNGNKVMTCGAGGMLVTDDEALARRARHLTTQAKQDPIEYVHDEVGFNYRLSNVLAALGCAQLERLDALLAAKRRIARRYADALASIPGLRLIDAPAWGESAWWLPTARVDAAAYGADRRALLARLAERGIQSRPLWQPLNESPAHAGAQAYRIELATRLHEEGLSLPCSTGMTEAEQGRVIAALQTT